MRPTRRHLLQLAGMASVPVSTAAGHSPVIQPGPFHSGADSFRSYACPDWFRDAKLGFWAHWGPTSAIGEGDWYARNMYIQGHRQYVYHVKTYGHPSRVGYKDTIASWKAEAFDPKALIRLYADSGARYFVSMGVHCDNFDLWNSRGHRWNSVRMGPGRDIVGEWRKAARDAGLRFGVSEHVWASYHWWDTNKGADRSGPLGGVQYDGSEPANSDLYFPRHAPGTQAWAEQGDESEAWKREWFRRAQDLIDQHQPDLYYEDGPIPFGSWGRSLVAHYYNQSLRRNGGKVDVVFTAKRRSEAQSGACVLDVERGVTDDIEPQPFQTDTCLGDWHYKHGIEYKRPKTVIDLLVDVVSRNGNLLLNIPLPGSGLPDPDELGILAEIRDWMKINGEAIYATRPWKIFGEGPGLQKSATGGGMNGTAEHFNEKHRQDLTGSDIRFTVKGNLLYAFAMGHNPRETLIPALRPASGRETRLIASVDLLGSTEPLQWKLGEAGLAIASPAVWPSNYAVAFRIAFHQSA